MEEGRDVATQSSKQRVALQRFGRRAISQRPLCHWDSSRRITRGAGSSRGSRSDSDVPCLYSVPLLLRRGR